jgi:hypothetical protein
MSQNKNKPNKSVITTKTVTKTVITTTKTSEPKTENKWVDKTSQFAANNNMSFGEALSNANNRCQYYDTMIDRNKHFRGPNLLQLDHPAMQSQQVPFYFGGSQVPSTLGFIPGSTAQDKKLRDEILIQTKRSMCGKTPTFKKK